MSLKDLTNYKIGGKIRYFYEVDSIQGIEDALNLSKRENVPFFILGAGTNILASDDEFPGVVIKPVFRSLDLDGDAEGYPGMSGIDQNSPLVGAAAVDMLVAAIQRGQRGFPKHPLRTEIEGTWTPGKTTSLRRGGPR